MGRGKRQGGPGRPLPKSAAAAAAAAALLPPEHADYFAATERKHFSDEAVGSRFLEIDSLTALLAAAAAQRGSLAGDDRARLLALGADEDAFLVGCRYLLVQARGQQGMVDSSGLPGETPIQVLRTKPGTPCSLAVDVEALPEVELATVIIGPNEAVERSSEEMLWTAHPGLPCCPALTDEYQEGASLTVAELRAAGGDRLLQARLRQPSDSANTGSNGD